MPRRVFSLVHASIHACVDLSAVSQCLSMPAFCKTGPTTQQDLLNGKDRMLEDLPNCVW